MISGQGIVTFTTPTVLGTSASFSSNVYSPDTDPSGSSSTQTTIILESQLNTSIITNNGSSATFQIQRNRNGAGWVGVGNVGILQPGIEQSTSLSFTDSTALTTDDYRVQIISYTPPSFGIDINLNTTSYFKVTQTPPPSLGSATSPYWTKSGNVLTLASGVGGLNSFYGQKQEDITGSGFFNIVNDFILQPVDSETGTLGDEIRFEGTETQTYTVTAVSKTNPIQITVDRDITATNINWFLVRRYVDAPGNIIIEADKPAGGTSPGFFMPQYATKGIEDNFDTVIQKLKTDQLI